MAIQRTVKKSFSDKMIDIFVRNMHSLAVVCGLILLCVGMFCAYKLWIRENNRSAQKHFGSLIMEYNTIMQEKNPDFGTLLEQFQKGYQKHSRASVVPYYKSYAVHILLQQNKKDEAIALLDTIIAETQTSSMVSVYQMERALIALDMQDSELQKDAEKSLIALANDSTNQFHDSALFYLGRYYWANDQIALAREAWQKLVDEQADEKIAPSPWAQQVKEYLALIIAR